MSSKKLHLLRKISTESANGLHFNDKFKQKNEKTFGERKREEVCDTSKDAKTTPPRVLYR